MCCQKGQNLWRETLHGASCWCHLNMMCVTETASSLLLSHSRVIFVLIDCHEQILSEHKWGRSTGEWRVLCSNYCMTNYSPIALRESLTKKVVNKSESHHFEKKGRHLPSFFSRFLLYSADFYLVQYTNRHLYILNI